MQRVKPHPGVSQPSESPLPQTRNRGNMRKIIRAIETISEWSGKIVCWLVLIFTIVLGYEIVMRYAFNAPTKWAFDISYMLGGSYFWLGEGYTLLKKKHVRIDIFYRTFSRRKQALVDIFFSLIFFFPLWGVLLYKLIPYVYLSWVTDERSMQGYWMPILYPFKTVMPVGVALLLLQGIAEMMRSILVLVRGENP
jgi:TRAP-type mannitol/chloroaromatic compound transport system permease small subunit